MSLKKTPAFGLRTTVIIIVLFCVGLSALHFTFRKYWFESLPNTPRVIEWPWAATLINGQTVLFTPKYTFDQSFIGSNVYTFDLPSRTFKSVANFELFNNRGELNKSIPVHGNEGLLGYLLCWRSKRFKKLENCKGVLLATGKVLVVGGRKRPPRADEHPDSREAYPELSEGHYYLLDPKTDAIEDLGAMVNPRHNASLTLLDNNQILVSGGQACTTSTYLNDIELFNYATQQAKALNPMSIQRSAHCATLLKDKMVLITGGGNLSDSMTDVELYDVDSGKSISLPPMKYGCMNHCAHRLSDNLVLLVGGTVFWPGESDGGHSTDEAQLFCSK